MPETAVPRSIQGPALFLAQFVREEAPYNSLDGLAAWAAGLGYRGVQVPAWESPRLIDLPKAAESSAYAEDWLARLDAHDRAIDPTL